MTNIALVTGANGFVGSHLTDLLIERGWKVRCLVRKTSSLRWLPQDRVELCYGEVIDPESLAPAVRGVDAVFHVAGVTHADNEAGYNAVNAEGTRNLVRAVVREIPSLERFVLVSSLAAGGPAAIDAPRKESDPDGPIGAYGQSKKLGEEELKREAGEMRWTIIRPPAVYGTRDVGFLILAQMAAKGWVFRLSGTPQPACTVEIGDLVRGIVDAVASQATVGKVYYVAHTELTGLTRMGEIMAQALGIRWRHLTVPRGMVPAVGWGAGLVSAITRRRNPFSSDRIRDLTVPAWTCDSSRAREDFGFQAEITVEKGLPVVMKWYRQEGWI
jgi:nucleoside-diphosphate-sugar epimerase